jgi:hypothetical protein
VIPERNKALVLEALDTLLNQGDDEAPSLPSLFFYHSPDRFALPARRG